MGSPQARLVWFGLPCQVASQIILAFFTCSTKIEKEKKEHAKLHGMIRTEISGAEIAEEMEKERRLFQLQMCEVRAGGCRFLRGAGSQLGGWVLSCSRSSPRVSSCGECTLPEASDSTPGHDWTPICPVALTGGA